MLISAFLPLFLSLAALQSGARAPRPFELSIFQGESGQPGQVLRVPQTGGIPYGAAGLAGIQLLHLDFSGRTQFEEFDPKRPHRIQDLPGASRLCLPSGAGSLYHYSRAIAGGLRFGFFLVDSFGTPRSLVELPGTGSLAQQDPWLPCAASDAQGKRLLLATTVAAGGDLYTLELGSGVAALRTAGLPPQVFTAGGLALGQPFAFAASTSLLLRVDCTASGDAQPVLFEGTAPAWLAGELALSRSGTCAVTIAGSAPGAAHVYVLAGTGPATRASDVPHPTAGAGYLPGSLDGPFLAVSDDGQVCAWVTAPGTRELYMARRQAGTWLPAQHVTADALFHPFLDEIGQFSFSPLGALTFAAGDRKDPILGGLARMDYFRATYGAQGLEVEGLTTAYGQSQPPFNNYGQLDPVRAALTPSRDWALVHSVGTYGNRIMAALLTGHGGQAPAVLAEDVDELKALSMTGPHGVIVFESEQGPDGALVRAFSPDPTTPTLVFPLNEDDLGATGQSSSGGWTSLATDEEHSALWRIHPGSGLAAQLPSVGDGLGPTVWYASDGALVFSVEQEGQRLFLRWTPQGSVVPVASVAGPAFLLPGG